MDITTTHDRGVVSGPPDYFVGDVLIEKLVDPRAPARTGLLRVQFAAGARTNWHTHTLGQVLYVLAGSGRVQMRGEPVRQIGPGDRVWIPPDIEHWHGAAPGHTMTHLAMQEGLDGVTTTWLDPVSDADYTAAPTL